MLVIVHNRHIELSFERIFNIKTLWSSNIFQIYTTKARSNVQNRFNNFVRVLSCENNRKSINVGKLFKQNCLSFHNW